MTTRTRDHQPKGLRAELHALKRARIVDAAVRLFYERGYDGTTVDALAADIGVAKPFIYSHFSSKQAILETVYEQSATRLHANIEAVVASDQPVPDKLAGFLREFTLENIDRQVTSGVYLQEEKNLSEAFLTRIRAVERSFNDLLAGLVAQGCEEGHFHVTQPKLAALSIAGMVRWVHRWYSPDGPLSPEELAEEIAQLGLNLVGYRG